MRSFLLLLALTPGLVCAAEKQKGSAPSAAPTFEQLSCAKVRGIYGGKTIQLKDGVYEGEPFVAGGASRPRVMLLGRLTATANLDNQPGDERVALLAESSGGSGENIFLAVFGEQDGNVVNLGTALVGDRVRLRRLDIDGRTMLLDVVEAGPGEPMCCPTQLARTSYRLEPERLQLVAADVTGVLSLAAIADVEWTLEEMNGRPLAPGSRAPTFKVAGGIAGGFGGCNRYTGAVQESTPGNISLGNLAATRMACADPQMMLEDGFLRDLKRVTSYTFLEGRLALRWEDGGQSGLLMFRR